MSPIRPYKKKKYHNRNFNWRWPEKIKSKIWKFSKIKNKNSNEKNPVSIDKNTLAAHALSIMNTKKITSLCVHKGKQKNKTIGIIHIHNILEANIS